MPDNIIAPGAGAVLAFRDVGGVLFARSIPTFVSGGAAVDVSAASPLPVGIVGSVVVTGAFYQETQPVSGPLTDAQLRETAVPVSVGGVATAANQATEIASLATIAANTSTAAAAAENSEVSLAAIALQTEEAATSVLQTLANDLLGLINGKLPALVGGRMPVNGSGVTQPVSGTFWQATQPVSIAAMPSTPVTGTFWQATQPVSAASLPLPSGAATGALQTAGTAVLASIDGKIATLGPKDAAGSASVTLATEQTTASGAVLVGNNRSKIRDDFAGPVLDATKWQLVQTGAGQAITFPGVTTSYLNINSGVTANAVTIIRSLEIFRLPLRLSLGVSASQRIVNTEFFVELVECDADGTLITTAPANTNTGTSPDYAAIKFDNVTATTAMLIVRGGGAPETVVAASPIVTTTALGTGPNFQPANALELQVNGEQVALLSSAIDTTGAAAAPRRVTQSAPDPNAFYKLQLRLRNLGTAPASATDYRVHFLRLFDFTRLSAEIVGGAGSGNAANSVPVNVAGGLLSAVATGTAIEDATLGAAAPVLIGGMVRTGAAPATLVQGDAVRLTMTSSAAAVVKLFSVPETDFTYTGVLTTAVAAAASNAVAGARNHAASLQYQNSGTVATTLEVLDGATVKWQGHAPANMAAPASITFAIPLRGTTNTALNVKCGTTGANVLVNVQGYQAL